MKAWEVCRELWNGGAKQRPRRGKWKGSIKRNTEQVWNGGYALAVWPCVIGSWNADGLLFTVRLANQEHRARGTPQLQLIRKQIEQAVGLSKDRPRTRRQCCEMSSLVLPPHITSNIEM